MTTKTGEKLRGRKRDPSVLEKAWATRRANKRKAKRAALATAAAVSARASMIRATKPIGSTKRGRKAAKAPTSRATTRRRFDPEALLKLDPAGFLKDNSKRTGRRSSAAIAAENMKALLAVEQMPATNMAGASEAEGANRALTFHVEAQARPASVFDKIDVTARALAVEARKHSNDQAIENRLRSLMSQAYSDGLDHAHRDQHHISRKTFEAARDKIVCSAIGVLEGQMQSGGLPPTVLMSSYTLCRMIDALNSVGYTANGRTKT